MAECVSVEVPYLGLLPRSILVSPTGLSSNYKSTRLHTFFVVLILPQGHRLARLYTPTLPYLSSTGLTGLYATGTVRIGDCGNGPEDRYRTEMRIRNSSGKEVSVRVQLGGGGYGVFCEYVGWRK